MLEPVSQDGIQATSYPGDRRAFESIENEEVTARKVLPSPRDGGRKKSHQFWKLRSHPGRPLGARTLEEMLLLPEDLPGETRKGRDTLLFPFHSLPSTTIFFGLICVFFPLLI